MDLTALKALRDKQQAEFKEAFAKGRIRRYLYLRDTLPDLNATIKKLEKLP